MPDLVRILLLVCGGGGVGGLLYWTSLYLVASNSSEETPKVFPSTPVFALAQVFTGMGGAWAVLLATIWGRRASLGANLEEELQLFATSLIAGYAGNRLLPLVADQLTKQIVKEAERRTAVSAMQAQRSELTSEVYTYLDLSGSQSAHQTAMYESRLQGELRSTPDNRKAAILLARLYGEVVKAPDKAVRVLEDFVAHKLADGAKGDEDVADVYWNIANYDEQLYRMSGGSTRAYRDGAIEALRHSILIVPGYAENLLTDWDFQALRTDAEAKKKLPALEG